MSSKTRSTVRVPRAERPHQLVNAVADSLDKVVDEPDMHLVSIPHFTGSITGPLTDDRLMQTLAANRMRNSDRAIRAFGTLHWRLGIQSGACPRLRDFDKNREIGHG